MKLKVEVLWIIFFLTILAPVTSILGDLFGLSFSQTGSFNSSILFIPVVFLFLHSIWTLSFFRGIIFILIACITGYIFEFNGLKYGTVFGGNYIYSLEGIKISTVPLNIILYWGVFIYAGYCITNSFLYWLNKEKPSKNNKAIFLLPLLILIDGLIVVAIDLFMDPLQVRLGSWTWPDGGPYFGIPVRNFIAWASVAFITTGLFRMYEYFKPTVADKNLKPVLIMPVLGYGFLYLYFFVLAIKINMAGLALIGSLTMLPVVLFNLFFFIKSLKGGKDILAW